MRRFGAILALLFVTAGQAGAQDAAWWRNTQVQQALRLTTQQVTRLEEIFHRDVGPRITRRRTLTRLEADLDDALKAGDIARIEDSRLIDRIETLRARINVRRTMMLIAMYRVLSPDQRTALASVRPAGRVARR